MIRCRILYQKTEPLRYTGNLDLQKIWERFLRRADLPVAYSQGFHPQPRIQQAVPLPLGFLSTGELTDIYLDDDNLAPAQVISSLEAMPYPGIEITKVEMVDLSQPSLATRVRFSEYRAEFFDPVDAAELTTRVTDVLAAPNLIRTRREKEYDLRPLIESLEVIPSDSGPTLKMTLAARQSATGRPEEVLSALGFGPYDARYTRTRILLAD
ncbi:MAG TPA: TIGR03936 family radical SAM-associated protein [Bellilinea sp.]|nr:TIGR03936 family radical SAM-associated protein [Bellilinea sp.]